MESAAPSAPSAHDPQATEKAASKILVVIDKSTQEMKVYVDNIERNTWQVSTGLAGYDTPSGTYMASSMNEIWYSKEWDDAPMPHAIFFTKKGHAIHGTEETKKLGMPASHGCVRLSPENARTLFLLVEENSLENTEIVLNGDIPRAKTSVARPEPRKQHIKSAKKSTKTAVKKAKPSAKKVAKPTAATAKAAGSEARKQQVKVPEAFVEGPKSPAGCAARNDCGSIIARGREC
ncbi:MAG: L,D-transpeptidase [Methyloceanibacter sp.]|uniref:L,D-transpeptidase n=1 Tax=Methyloceanibacter sp. TaxID=1965321 RepID=UPI003D6D0F0A